MLALVNFKEGKMETFMGRMQSDEGMGVRKSVAYTEKKIGAMKQDKKGKLIKVTVHNEPGEKEYVSGNNTNAKESYEKGIGARKTISQRSRI